MSDSDSSSQGADIDTIDAGAPNRRGRRVLRLAVFGPLTAENGWDGDVTRPSPAHTSARTRL